ncbi:MAG: membrane protein insertase YidC [Candidatus Binatia bacterium]
MDKRSFLAIVLSLFVLLGYQLLITSLYPPLPTPESLPPEQPHPRTPQDPSPSSQPPPLSSSDSAAPAPTEKPSLEGKVITVDTEDYIAEFSSYGGRLKSFRLKHYPQDGEHSDIPLEMVQTGSQGELPLGVLLEGKGITISDHDIAYVVDRDQLTLRGKNEATLEFRGRTANGTTITKTFTLFGQGYGMTLALTTADLPPEVTTLSIVWTHAFDQHHSSYYSEPGPVALVGRKFIYKANSSIAKDPQTLGPDRIRWAGYADSYFLAAIIPPEGDNHTLYFRANDGNVITKLALRGNEKQPVIYTVYVGPKEVDALNEVNPSLDRAIDFGWSHFIARPLLSLLRLSHTLTGNYGLDIILLTVLVKLAFFPLSNKAFKSMNDMKKIQPQLEQIREQYKDDREKLNKEMMELYRRNHVNPFGGCLPMLVQLPVFIGLYQVLLHAIELRQAPFFGWIQDLSSPDRLGDIWLPLVDPPGIPVLTLLMGGSMLIQQAMTPTPGDPTQQKMMMIMPVIFTVMFVNFPAGLVLYWLVNNVLSIAQQYAYNKGLV